MLLKYDLRETARYMGYKHGASPSEEICELCEEAYEELCKVITPKYIYKEIEMVNIENELDMKVRLELEQNQREYLLKEKSR